MTAAPEGLSPKIDVRSLSSVRRAFRAAASGGGGDAGGHVILGDDWVAGEADEGSARRRGFIVLRNSPLARKIVTFNLVALILLVAGMLWFTPSRESLAFQRARSLANEAGLVARLVEVQIEAAPDGAGIDDRAIEAFAALEFQNGAQAVLFHRDGRVAALARSGDDQGVAQAGRTPVGDALNGLWDAVARLRETEAEPFEAGLDVVAVSADLVARALGGELVVDSGADLLGRTLFTVVTPIRQGGEPVGAVAVRSAVGEIDALVRLEREQVLRMFLVAGIISIGLSLVLASTIANPLSDLAAAAESGRARDARNMSPSRVRIPDLSARPDEIGRLSAALRGMVTALYERIEANEQFAADVAHEIKNPLASLRSAVGSFPFAKRDDQRQKLLDIIEHDVRRLDRLVSDISNASRLDSELVKEEEKPFDLLKMLGSLEEFLGAEAKAKGVDLVTDLPQQPVVVHGLEGRLAQVFVNLITNAISFCEDGDAVRVWARRRANRVLVVVEDTGPGIPEEALSKIFQRFYSQRPEGQFGNNSGLGLAISKQIVEAHGGVIWAENIRPTRADPDSAPLGARFVVGLPV